MCEIICTVQTVLGLITFLKGTLCNSGSGVGPQLERYQMLLQGDSVDLILIPEKQTEL